MRWLTPPGPAAIAVARFDGEERAVVSRALRARDGRPVRLEPSGPPRLALLRVGAVDLDEVLAVDRGAAGLELHVHGSPVVRDALTAAFGADSSPSPSPAERLLRDALSRGQLQLAIEQRAVDFDRFLAELSKLPLAARAASVAAALSRSRVARALAEPFRVALVGRQNAGKSTLMNRLLFRERVLAGPLPGLTRDPIHEIVELDGYPYEVIDTAGEGPADSELDRAAIARSRRVRESAAVLLVVDRSDNVGELERTLARTALLVLATKADLPAAPWPVELPCHVQVAALAPESAVMVRRMVGEALRQRRGLPAAGPVWGPAALDAAQQAALQGLLRD